VIHGPAIPAIGLAAILAVCAGCPSRQPEPHPSQRSSGTRPALDADQVAGIATRYNLAIGSLGMEEYGDAVAQWEELSRTLPDEPAVATNLTVAYLMWLRSQPPARRGENGDFAAALSAARQAVQRLLVMREDDPASHLLAARLARLADDEPGMWEALDRAVALAPNDPVVWFDRFQAARGSSDQDSVARGAEAIRRTHELVPDNLFVLIQLTWQQAADHDAAIADSLLRLRQLAEPLVGDSPRLQKVDLAAMFAQAVLVAAAAVRSSSDSDDWRPLTAMARRIGNVLLGETPTRIDFRRLDRQNERDRAELEFIRPRPDAGWGASAPVSAGQLGPPVSVRLHAASDDQPLPVLPDVQAVEVLDFDLDGRLDVIAVGRQAIAVYGRAAGGAAWQRLAAFTSPQELRGVVAADLDRDVPLRASEADHPGFHRGDADLVAFGPAGVLILENRLDAGTGRRELREPGQTAALRQRSDVSAAGLADVDHDGDLDLVASGAGGVSLWLNEGQFSFRDISERSVLPAGELRFGSIVAADWNGDRDLDVLLAGPTGEAVGWLENRRHGRFAWHALPAEPPAGGGVAGLQLIDPDGDGAWDWLSVGVGGLALRPGDAERRCRPAEIVDQRVWNGLRLWDYDNDGYRDLVAWGAAGLAFWQGTSEGRFRSVSLLPAETPQEVRHCAVGDVDADGDVDLLVVKPDRAAWYVNEGGNRNGWLDVVLEPAVNPEQFPDLRVNLDGWGSLIEVRVGPVCQTQTAALGPLHFGLGAVSQADLVQVRWTNGLTCTRRQPPAGQPLRIEQVLKGM